MPRCLLYDFSKKNCFYPKWVITFFAFILLFSKNSYSQDSTSIIIQLDKNCKDNALLNILSNELNTFSYSQTQEKLKTIRKKLIDFGYFQSTFETTQTSQKNYAVISIFPGKRFRWSNLENGNIDQEILEELNYGELIFKNRIFSLKELSIFQSKILKFKENNGFPFTYIFLDSIQILNDSLISAKIYLDQGPEIRIDSFQIEAKIKDNNPQKIRISKKYLMNYLGIKKGSLYNEEQIIKLKTKIRELSFLNSYRDPQVLFRENNATVFLFLESRNSSKFDILFGLLPSTNPVTLQQQFNFTGNVNIDLINSFGRGERILASWQQFQRGRSELKLGFTYPFLFNSPVGIDAKFELYNRDSTYIDIIPELGLSYMFDGNNYLKVFWKNMSTNVQNPNINFVLNNKKLPSILDVRNNSFGLEYYFQRLNYRWNPLKGYELKVSGSIGYKYIKPNNAIISLTDPASPDFAFSSLYDSLSLRTIQYSAQFSYTHYFKLWKQLCLMGRYRTAIVYNNNNQLYNNELLRIGGQQIMRGFDEQSIFASWYQIITTELRFLLGTNSYAYLFGDFSQVQNNSLGNNIYSFRYGFGLGIALETKIGIFGLSYALGTSIDNPIIFRNGKVHFGYINLF